jgi:GMP synthase-like glutamine amidotransferase
MFSTRTDTMETARVLIIQNDEPETLGLYETILRDKEVQLSLIHAYKMRRYEEFPPVNEYDAFMIGPTPISANDAQNHVFLQKEWRYLKEIVESGKLCLGVCCGGQMLAKLLGGEVVRSPMKEVGGYTVKLTDEGIKDPIFSGFSEDFSVFQWHSDMFTIPPGGILLAEGDPCLIQAFRKDSVYGVIFHLEIGVDDAKRWVEAYPDEPQYIGKTREQVLEECRLREPEMRGLATLFMENFLRMVG